MACLLCSLAFGLYMAFNHEASQGRRNLNAAMYEAQLYLSQRESLLAHLGHSILPLPAKSARTHTLALLPENQEPSLLSLGRGDNILWLAARDLAVLREKRLGLVFVEADSGAKVHRLVAAGDVDAPLPSSVLSSLYQQAPLPAESGVRWLADAQDLHGRLYMFDRVAAGWLGLEIRGDDLNAALHIPSAGDYQLLNGEYQLVFGRSMELSKQYRLCTQGEEDCFIFSNSWGFPLRMVLLKHIGQANWAMVYSLSTTRLIAPLWRPTLLALLISSITALLLLRLLRRAEQRLILPAEQHIAALKESAAFFRVVLSTAPVALCVLRRTDAAVVLVNPQAEQWLGNGRVIQRYGTRWIERAFAMHGGATSEDLTVDGARHLHLSYTPTRYKGEDVLFCAFSDISAHKEVEAELCRAKQLADTANQAKTLFLATMSHEIRTPLYGMLGTLELLGRTHLNPKQNDYLEAIQQSSATLLQLISDVLDVSKIEAGQLTTEQVKFSPLELTEEVLQSFTAAARAKGLQLLACIDSQLPAIAYGDAGHIRQVLNNLLSNAVKFSENGRVLVRLRVDEMRDEHLCLSWQVADHGCGISAELQDRLFEPFYQVAGRSWSSGGTGLGLPICQRLTELMHGHLWLVSEPGLGSSFTLSLPLRHGDRPTETQQLCGIQVQVRAPLREMGESLCAWIERWGARARLASPSLLAEADERTVLVEVLLDGRDSTTYVDWPGCRVLMLPDGLLQPESQGCDWAIGLHSLSALKRALALAHGCDVSATLRERLVDESRNLAGLRVLVVEDNPINQLILHDQLKDLGCHVELAGNGLEALQKWHPERFEVVLTDVNMPRMDGYRLASELRQRGCQQAIVGATANAMPEERERCLAAGMDDCLLKPVDLGSLYRCLLAVKEIA